MVTPEEDCIPPSTSSPAIHKLSHEDDPSDNVQELLKEEHTLCTALEDYDNRSDPQKLSLKVCVSTLARPSPTTFLAAYVRICDIRWSSSTPFLAAYVTSGGSKVTYAAKNEAGDGLGTRLSMCCCTTHQQSVSSH